MARREEETKEFEERVVTINRVVKVRRWTSFPFHRISSSRR